MIISHTQSILTQVKDFIEKLGQVWWNISIHIHVIQYNI